MKKNLFFKAGILLLSLFLLLVMLGCRMVSSLMATQTPTSTPTPTPTSTPTPTPTSTPTPTPTSTPTPTPTPTPMPTPVGGAEWIVFAAQRDGDDDTDIYAARIDGSEVRQLTNDPANDWSPDLSPDGQRVVFVSDRDGDKNLYMINVDGTGLTQLTLADDNDYDPDWSPDGQHIAFVSSRTGSTRSEIWTARIGDEGLDLSTLTLVTYDDFNDYNPAWSPDGRMIAYSSFRINPGKGYSIFIMNADGSQMRQVTTGLARDGWDRLPQWSPDGQGLIFVRWSSGDIEENRGFWTIETWDEKLGVLYTDKFEPHFLRGSIYTVNVDGTGVRPLMEDENDNWAPCWAPDGQWIVFTSDRDGDSDIYIMKPDGTSITAVTRNDTADSMPSCAGPIGLAAGGVEQWRTILSDSFDNNRYDWDIYLEAEDEWFFSFTQQIVNGVYRWEAEAKKNVIHWTYPDIPNTADFHLSVLIRQVSGADDAAAGVIFRLNPGPPEYYTFRICPGEQTYAFELWHNGEWTTLVDWTYSSAIAPDGWNRIEVMAIGSQFTFRINGRSVESVSDSTLSRGKVGLALGIFNAGDEAVVEFDDFDLRVP